MAETSGTALPIGTVVYQRYRIMAIVGRGGLGTVYQVMDVLYGKQNVYALKELIDQSPGARRQFELESQWLQSLDHNHIPKVREHFEWGRRLYLVMDFVDGENLEEKLTRNGGRPLSEMQTLAWMLPVCDALRYLHSRVPPILHRDVKPANIIVTPSNHAVLVDLGIAKEHLPGAGQTATFVRKAGTEGYAPPEQYTVAGQTGPWSDVYGVGATLYHLLTGRVPPTAVERVALDSRLMPPRELNPSVSPHVSAAITHALALRPVERFAAITDLAHALVTPLGTGGIQVPRTPYPSPVLPPSPAVPLSPAAPPSAPDARITGHLPIATGRAHSPTAFGPDTASQLAGRPIDRTAQQVALSSTPRLGAPSRAGLKGKAAGGGARSGVDARAEPRRSVLRSPVVLGVAGVLAAALVIGLVATLLVVTAPPDRSSPRAAVTGYFTALASGDYERAWLFATASRNAPNEHDTFVATLRADDVRYGRVHQIEITRVDDPTLGKVTVAVDVTRGVGTASANFSYIVVLTQFDGNTWLLDSAATA